MRAFGRFVSALTLPAFLGACQLPPADQSAPAAEAVLAADIAWAEAFSSGDIDAAVAFVDSSGSILAPNTPIATGPEAVTALMEEFHSTPGLTFRWKATGTGAARSGELGYSTGTYELTFTDPKGQPATDRGKYVTVWRKKADGSWKAVLDMFNSDLPVPGAGG